MEQDTRLSTPVTITTHGVCGGSILRRGLDLPLLTSYQWRSRTTSTYYRRTPKAFLESRLRSSVPLYNHHLP